jgi:hypothetical protein
VRSLRLSKFDTVGADIVSHCVNDIITSSAFLYHIAVGKVAPDMLEDVGKYPPQPVKISAALNRRRNGGNAGRLSR